MTDGSGRDADVRRAVKAVRLIPVTPEMRYHAGALRAAAASARRKPPEMTVDAIVAATALTLPAPAVVLTSDQDDLRLLLDGAAVRVERIA